jgi:hypothetical protein
MCYYLKERLEDIQFFTLAQLHQRALACESRSKDTAKAVCHNVHVVECDQSISDDESKKCTLLRWFGQSMPNLWLVLLYNQFKRNDKKRSSLHLRLASVIKYSMNYSK